jgi:hypothetical protein
LIDETEVHGIYRGVVKPQRARNSDDDNRLFGAFCFGHETNQKEGKTATHKYRLLYLYDTAVMALRQLLGGIDHATIKKNC